VGVVRGKRRHPEIKKVEAAAGGAAGAPPQPWAVGGRGWRSGRTMG
jgi:hypothetical protein